MTSPTSGAMGLELWLHLDLDYTLFEVAFPDEAPPPLLEGEQRRNLQLWTGISDSAPQLSVTTINHRKFTQLFQKIESVNQSRQRDVVVVDILTDSTYGEAHVRDLLKDLFPALKINDFYNRNRAVKTKHAHIHSKYTNELSRHMIKRQVVLMDDNLTHCRNTKRLGYTVLPMGFSPAQDDRCFDWINREVAEVGESDMEDLAERIVFHLGI